MDQDYCNPGQWAQDSQDNQNPRMDSFEGILAKIQEMAEKDRLDSNGRNAQILAELSNTLTSRTALGNPDEVMDSLESVPSGVIRNFGGMEKTSLPHMDSTELERTFHLDAINNAELAVSPPEDTSGNSEATFHTLETYPLVTHPMVDPNQEIHGGPGVSFDHPDPIPMSQSESSVQFQQATSTSHIRDHNLVARDDEVMSTDSEELYKLSPENRLEITVHYSKYPVGGTVTVDRVDGCVLFYQKISPEFVDKARCVPFPSLQNTELGKKFAKANPKALELTERALNALQGGLQLYWANDELYALRKTRGKVYWTSTQSDSADPQELPRNVPAVVFQTKRFRLELSHAYAHKASTGRQHTQAPWLPAVYFSFAQKWCPKSSPISSCLVWVKVIPKKAEDMVSGLFPEASSAPFVTLNSFHLQLNSSS